MDSPFVELVIDRLSVSGAGVAQHNQRAVFVEGALPGERVRVSISDNGKVLTGRLLEVLKPHSGRRSPVCPVADSCGGCDWLFADEGVQREAKLEIVLSTLEHVGHISRQQLNVLPVVKSPLDMGYRRRAVFHFGGGRLGFFGRRSHQHVQVDVCPALTAPLADLPEKLSSLLGDVSKDIETVTVLEENGSVSVALSLKGKVKPRLKEAAEKAIQTLALQGAVLTPAEGPTEILGRPVLKGAASQIEGQPLYLRPDGFAQANALGNNLLVGAALSLLQAESNDRVLELYCGNGNFSFPLGHGVADVLAVESSLVAIELAQRAAKEGSVQTVRFVQGDVARVCHGLMKEGRQFTRMLLDPPRTGAPGVGKWALALEVGRVVYVACDAASLARDAQELISAGYRPMDLQLIDMFPQTRHIEAVMSFESELGKPRP